MLKLIKLEWKKNNIGKYIRNAIIMAALLCLFVLHWHFRYANDPDGTLDAAPGTNTISSPIEIVYKYDISYFYQCDVSVIYCKCVQK